MRIVPVTICLIATSLFAACSEEAPPISVAEFMENPRLLEAAMVRCGQNRAEMKYEVECVNARDAVNRMQRVEERERRARLEAQSERKRKQLRATQEAAAAARRRAEEERRQREEAEYLGIFEESPSGTTVTVPPPGATGSTATYAAPQATNTPATNAEPAPAPQPESGQEADVPVASGDDEVTEGDLSAIREELRRRQENPQ